MTESLVDQTVISELIEATGEEFAEELVMTFLEEAPQIIESLKAAAIAADADGYRRAAHSIKSNAYTFGATALAELARNIEAGSLPDGGDVSDATMLEAEFQKAAEALRDLFDE